MLWVTGVARGVGIGLVRVTPRWMRGSLYDSASVLFSCSSAPGGVERVVGLIKALFMATMAAKRLGSESVGHLVTNASIINTRSTSVCLSVCLSAIFS